MAEAFNDIFDFSEETLKNMNNESRKWQEEQAAREQLLSIQQGQFPVIPMNQYAPRPGLTPIFPASVYTNDQNSVVNAFETGGGRYIIEDTVCGKIYTIESKEQIKTINGQVGAYVFRNCKQRPVANLLFDNVQRIRLGEGFSEKYIINLTVMNPKNNIQFKIPQSDYEKKRIVYLLRQNALAEFILCGEAEANHVLSQYISLKMTDATFIYPYRTGFYPTADGAFSFISADNIMYSSEAVNNKTFPSDIGIGKTESLKALSDVMADSCEFALALTIHYTAMMSSILRQYDLIFSRIVVADEDYDTVREFLDVYGNLDSNTLISSGEAMTRLKLNTFCTRDDILYIGEQSITYKPDTRERSRAKENSEFLVNCFCKNQFYTPAPKIACMKAECLCVMIKGYLSDMIDKRRTLPLSLPKLSLNTGELRRMIRSADVYFVKWIRQNYKAVSGELFMCHDDIKNCTNDDFCSSNDGIILSSVFRIVSSFFKECSELKVDLGMLRKYLISFMDKTADDEEAFAVAQVRKTLSRLVSSGEVEIIHCDKIFPTRPRTEAVKVYYQGNNLYFLPKLFDKLIVSRIGGVTGCTDIKKHLIHADMLEYDYEGNYTVNIKLSGTGKQLHYTAVSVDMLNEEARDMLPSKYATFLPCKDDGTLKRIRLGHDDLNRGVYQSIDHPDMLNQTILVTGSPNCGKSGFVFGYAKSAALNDEVMVYIDYNHSCTKEQFMKFGVSSKWIDNNIRYVHYKNWDQNASFLLHKAHLKDQRHIIVITVDNAGDELSDEDKASVTDTLLQNILDWCMRLQNISPRVQVIIDEVNVANLGKNSIIDKIITQRRKFGISLIMISPDIMDLKYDERRTLMNASTKVVFRQDNNGARKQLAENMGTGFVSTLANHLGLLDKYVCCISGNFEDRSGDMRHEVIQVNMDIE